ncbi:MAG: DUF1318 domain-containing protein [Candidatus Omnitrophota bacterium]|jgi:uncharacterized protein YdbL (DUF1318 family)
MRKIFFIFIALFVFIGCARVRVEAPKEAIKLDVSMRLDIYQHVVKDIDAIEDIVSGKEEKLPAPKNGSRLDIFVKEAYAEDLLSPEVERAALNRRDRRPQLLSLEEKGIVAENDRGLVEARDGLDPSARALVEAENNDRMVIYKALAAKNGISVEEVQKIYSKKLRDSMSGD